jgi:hypothetical protein
VLKVTKVADLAFVRGVQVFRGEAQDFEAA